MLLAAGILALHVMRMQAPAADAGAAPVAAAASPSSPSSPAVREVVVGDLAKPQPPAPEQAVAAIPHQPAWLPNQTVKLAVHDAIASEPATPESNWPSQAYGADSKYREFDRAFAYARVPDCLHPNTLKFQPAQIGQVELVGEFAIPFWIAAVARGKCNAY